jgi:hypothetical protein
VNCHDSKELIWMLPLAEHSAATLAALEIHAQACADCSKLLRAERELTARLQQQRNVGASGSSADIVMAMIARRVAGRAGRLEPSPLEKPAGRTLRPGSRSPIWLAAGGIGIAFGAYCYAALSGQLDIATLSMNDGVTGVESLKPLDPKLMTAIVVVGIGLFLAGLLGTRDT